MSSPAPTHRPGGSAIGLPEGVYLAPMGHRIGAYLLDAVVPNIFALLALVNIAIGGPGWLSVIFWILVLLWLVVLWWMYGMLAAGPGMRLLGLQLVGLRDGRPIGLKRALLRGVVLAVITEITILLIIMLILMWRHPRRQGWHDLVAESLVIEQRPLAPARPGEVRDPRAFLKQLAARVPAAPPSPQPTPMQGPGARQAIDGPGGGLQQTPTASYSPPPVAPGPIGSAPTPPASTGPIPVAPPPPSFAPDPQPGAPGAFATEPPAPAAEWSVILDDNREIPITRLTLFGRNPQPRPGEHGAQLIKVVDEQRTVSKTHLAITVDPSGVFVTDRGSTNGSAVTDPQGVYNLIAAEQPVRLSGEGCIISFGNHHLRLIRH